MACPYRPLPPLGTLRTFEAVARHRSFTMTPQRAANNLEVVPSARLNTTTCRDGKIGIEMPNGVRVRVGRGVDLKVLRGVLTILDGR
jgi:hypothetical protein